MITNERLETIAALTNGQLSGKITGDDVVFILPHELAELVREVLHYRSQHAQPAVIPVHREKYVDGYRMNPNSPKYVHKRAETKKRGKKSK